jgi:hypothetical protein
VSKSIFALLCSFLLVCNSSFGQTVVGSVRNREGAFLPYATIEIKNNRLGTTANAEGMFNLNLPKGKHTITCQHVGYEKIEVTINIEQERNTLDFVLKPIALSLQEVVVKRGEDPAYAIIRNAIKKREVHRKEWERFTAEVYTKGQLRLRDYPTKFMGQKVDFEDGDTSKRKIIFLSESVATYSVAPPNKSKIEVLATKVSGQSNAYGLSAPQIISFYNNNVTIGENLNSHGFISPIAENALHFYTYKYEGAFFEDGRQISRIKMQPKRKFEPLFSGYINIVEDEWRIHSLQLQLTKESRMEWIDTLRLEQLYVPSANQWVLKSQIIYPSIKLLGFDGYGSFANIYSSYNFSPSFLKGYFDNIIIRYADSATQKEADYWTTTRPIVLQQDEIVDYRKKDSLEQVRESPEYMDSLDRIRNKTGMIELVTSGLTLSDAKSKSSISFPSLLELGSYNTVEGFVGHVYMTYRKRFDTLQENRKSIAITPKFRYGQANQHFNASLTTQYTFGKRFPSAIYFAGGKDVYQFNNAGPVSIIGSTFSALVSGRNNMKIYEAWFGNFLYSKSWGKGVNIHLGINYQDRLPLENNSRFTLDAEDGTSFTLNRPYPLTDTNILRHQVFSATLAIRWQPGTRYIQYPNRMVSLGSKIPVFEWRYTQAFDNVWGSDVAYGKWLMRINDQMNFKLLGKFDYRIEFGGFIYNKRVEVPDLIHYRGNTSSFLSGDYLTRFQLVPHYYFSNSQPFYSTLFAEHHFNGFITNKVPGLKHWKWNLVAGVNALYLNTGRYYVEPVIGVENILKLIRLDYIWGFEKSGIKQEDFRIGIKTTLGNNR